MNEGFRTNSGLLRSIIFGVIFLLSCSSEIGLAKYLTKSEEKDHYLRDYNFSKYYFTPHIPIWNEILSHLKGKPNIHYLEIGVFEGGSAIWMLENILTAPNARMTCIDPFFGNRYKIFLDNLRLSGFIEKVIIRRGYSQTELRNLPLNSFDIVYIDGSHVAKDVLIDIVLSWDILKFEGIMILDDYNWGTELPAVEKPKIAIDTFLEIFKSHIKIIHHKWQVIIQKI